MPTQAELSGLTQYVQIPDQEKQPTTIPYEVAVTAGVASAASIAYYGITTEGQYWFIIGSALLTNWLATAAFGCKSLTNFISLKNEKKYGALFATALVALILALPYGFITYLEADTNSQIILYGAPISTVLGFFLSNGCALGQLRDEDGDLKKYMSPSNNNFFTYLIKAVFAAFPLYSALAVTCATDVSLQSDLGASPLLGVIGGNIAMLGEDFLSITGGIAIASELITVLSNLYKGEKISDQITKQSVISWLLAIIIASPSGYTAERQLGECASSLMKPIGNFWGAGGLTFGSSSFFNTKYLKDGIDIILGAVMKKTPALRQIPDGSMASMGTRYGAV